jgi:hypothetical protein
LETLLENGGESKIDEILCKGDLLVIVKEGEDKA